MTNYDISKPYIQYIEDVLSGREIAGWFVIKACERAKSWFYRDDIELRYDEIDVKVRLVQKIKHKKGLQAGKSFTLLPFQQFIFMNIFGWYYVGTDRRVISNVLLMMARQTGKSFTAAAIALAIALDQTLAAPTVDYIANAAKQAAIAFGHCKDQTASIDPNGKIFSRYRSEIRIPLLGSSINVLSSDDSKLDGRASYFISDEIHENKNWRIWEILKSGQGSLKNPLAIGISTCGYHLGEEYPLYSMWKQAKMVLNGDLIDDSWFYLIFQLDEDDDWKDETVWKKAIPTLGIAVDYDFIKGRVQEAINNPTKEVEVKTKNLNLWCQSEQTWIPRENIEAVSQPFELSIFNPEEIYSILGVDIGERSDLCVVSALIPYEEKLYFKAFPFICKTALTKSANKDIYRQWVKDGYITLVDEPSIDIDWVIKYIQDINKQVPVACIAYDQWHAKQLAIKCLKEGMPMKAISQSIGSFAEPTSQLEHLIYEAKEIVIDDNPVTKWCFGNVLIKQDENSNRKPVKADGPGGNAKIDIVITFIQALKLWLQINGIELPTDVVVLES